MKHYLHLILLLFCLNPYAAAQTIIKWEPKEQNPANLPTDDQGNIRFREVVETPKITPGTVLKRAKTWAAKTYPSANEMIQQYDTTQGVMIIKGVLNLKPGGIFGHQLVIEAKDGRYRATIDEPKYLYEITTPVKLTRELPVHTYGLTADDVFQMYQFAGGQTGVPMNYKKLAIKYANEQGPVLAQVKQTCESLLASLKKAITEDSDW